MEELNYSIVPDYDELEKEYWIRFKDLEVVSSGIHKIYMLVVNEVDGKQFKYNDYSKMTEDNDKVIWDLGVITYLYQFKSKEKFDEYKSTLTSISWLEWKFDGVQRPRTVGEFEYKWNYFLIVTNKELAIKWDEFDDMLKNPWIYLEIAKERLGISNKIDDII